MFQQYADTLFSVNGANLIVLVKKECLVSVIHSNSELRKAGRKKKKKKEKGNLKTMLLILSTKV